MEPRRRKERTVTGSKASLLLVLTLADAPVVAAQGFRWPEAPQNLKVLDVKGAELGRMMRGFTAALDVRCEYCHSGKEGATLDPNDLGTFDLASDRNPMKETARAMIAMTRAINETYLARLDAPTGGRPSISCITCHHGQTRPVLIQDLLFDVIEREGTSAAIARYRKLREDYYGGFAFDFGPVPLSSLGERLLDAGKFEPAVDILALENEFHPEFAFGEYLSGVANEKAGHLDRAIDHMKKAVERAPPEQKPFFESALQRLESK
jgi:tetratricopeptide (TPR) repeat protein